jgi:hypothetical protein
MNQQMRMGNTKRRIPQPDDHRTDLPLLSVVITLSGSGSYDHLFQAVPQKVPDGRVSVWHFGPEHFEALASLFSSEAPARVDEALAADLKELRAQLAQVPADNVVLNWECCGAWSMQWPDRAAFAKLSRGALAQGHLLMFSDFSMKSLIHCWDESYLGPNPFVELGQISGSMQLHFDPIKLSNCDSVQLQTVGELCGKGGAEIHAMGGTIVFGVDQRKADTEAYRLEVLTVVTNASVDRSSPALYAVGDHQGTVGHAMLHYPSGGILLCSSGHWIELQRIDVSQEAFLSVVASQYGESARCQMEAEINASPTPSAQLQKMSQDYVRQSSPSKLKR